MKPVTALLQGAPDAAAVATAERLLATDLVEEVLLLAPPGADVPAPLRALHTDRPGSARVLHALLRATETPWLLQVEHAGGVDLVPGGLARLIEVALSSQAVLTYADYTDDLGDTLRPHPLADYQEGSLVDGFDFGPLRLWSTDLLGAATRRLGPIPEHLRWRAWYDLRLKASAEAPIVRLAEPLCTRSPMDTRTSGASVFDYLTAGQSLQDEAEAVVSQHLERTGALLTGPRAAFVSRARFPVEASVIIPVRDRERTVADAVRSALAQETDFPFNVVVVDNHSTDGTTAILAELATADDRLVHHVPERRDLGIGGCWNEGVFHPDTGRYAVQLDSDDLYRDETVLAQIVAAFRAGQCGMVIGAYETVDFSLAPIAPGLIDHREWSDANGPNNALRVNGFGAPRAFATELLRKHPFPNVSYGEDYAVALRISREYRVGRIYHSLYRCRRWEDNTDADLPPATVARHQVYKDRLRTIELSARRQLTSRAGAA